MRSAVGQLQMHLVAVLPTPKVAESGVPVCTAGSGPAAGLHSKSHDWMGGAESAAVAKC